MEFGPFEVIQDGPDWFFWDHQRNFIYQKDAPFSLVCLKGAKACPAKGTFQMISEKSAMGCLTHGHNHGPMFSVTCAKKKQGDVAEMMKRFVNDAGGDVEVEDEEEEELLGNLSEDSQAGQSDTNFNGNNEVQISLADAADQSQDLPSNRGQKRSWEEMIAPVALDPDVNKWTTEHVSWWLKSIGRSDCAKEMAFHKVDGEALLLLQQENFEYSNVKKKSAIHILEELKILKSSLL